MREEFCGHLQNMPQSPQPILIQYLTPKIAVTHKVSHHILPILWKQWCKNTTSLRISSDLNGRIFRSCIAGPTSLLPCEFDLQSIIRYHTNSRNAWNWWMPVEQSYVCAKVLHPMYNHRVKYNCPNNLATSPSCSPGGTRLRFWLVQSCNSILHTEGTQSILYCPSKVREKLATCLNLHSVAQHCPHARSRKIACLTKC